MEYRGLPSIEHKSIKQLFCQFIINIEFYSRFEMYPGALNIHRSAISVKYVTFFHSVSGQGDPGVTGCASMPNEPSVMVLPGTGISFDQFRNDNAICQQFAFSQVGGTTTNQAGMNSEVTSGIVGTAPGMSAGAAFGGGSGAAIGAGRQTTAL
jgi:hypothetical protein